MKSSASKGLKSCNKNII